MSKKKFVLRINQEIYDKLEKWSADEFRSVNGQIEWIIRDALLRYGRISVHFTNKSRKGNKSKQEDVENDQ